ncbi:MAG: FecR domain-containing protein [Balneolaceae bacterium]
MKKEQEIWQLIQRFVTGNATPDERQKLHHWMDLDPANRQLVREVEKIWDMTPADEMEVNVQQAWRAFQSNVLRKKRKTGNRSIHGLLILRVAAVVLLTVMAGLFAYTYITSDPAAGDETASGHVLQLENLVTGKGEKASATFSDGTEVILNSASTLRFPEEFRGARREVHLEGEAYFDVAPNPDHPFIVHIRGAEIEVLGTEFNVRGWSEDLAVDVVVREGKVSVSAPGRVTGNQQEVLLGAGDFTRVPDGQGPVPVQQVEISDYLVWMSGGLYFKDTPFHQVLRDVERRFDVQITLHESGLSDVPFTGKFQYADLDEVLSIIAVSMEIDFRRDGSTVDLM